MLSRTYALDRLLFVVVALFARRGQESGFFLRTSYSIVDVYAGGGPMTNTAWLTGPPLDAQQTEWLLEKAEHPILTSIAKRFRVYPGT